MTEKEALQILDPHIPKYASSVIMEAWQLVEEKILQTHNSYKCPVCARKMIAERMFCINCGYTD
jgi:ribosomal protein L37AE/L43A